MISHLTNLEENGQTVLILPNKVKICCRCKIEKSIDLFPRNKRLSDGRDTRCSSCNSISSKNYRNLNLEKTRASTRRWYYANKSHVRDVQKRWGKNNPDKIKAAQKRYKESHPNYRTFKDIKRNFGIDVSEYFKILNSQNGVCLICNRPERRKLFGKITRLAIDHNHKTGKVRGLLCSNCNRALGLLEENLVFIDQMKKYILKNS